MTKIKSKTIATAVISEILAILVAIAIIVVVVVWLRQTYSNSYSNNHSETCIVTDCHNGNGNYVVTVESHDGNLWDYYSDVPKVRGYIVKLVFNENMEIIDVIN